LVGDASNDFHIDNRGAIALVHRRELFSIGHEDLVRAPAVGAKAWPFGAIGQACRVFCAPELLNTPHKSCKKESPRPVKAGGERTQTRLSITES
jgi:hypothetical protein